MSGQSDLVFVFVFAFDNLRKWERREQWAHVEANPFDDPWQGLCRCQPLWSFLKIHKRYNKQTIKQNYFAIPKEPNPAVQYRNEKSSRSQPEVLFHEILHLRESPLVGQLKTLECTFWLRRMLFPWTLSNREPWLPPLWVLHSHIHSFPVTSLS